RVTDAWPVMTGRPCHEVEFSDGWTVVADAGHLWRTTTNAGRIHTRAGFSGSTTLSAATLSGLESAMRSEPDRLVTASDLLQLTGGRLRGVIHAMANVTPVSGHVRRGTNHTHAYAAGVICRTLLAYAGTPRNARRIIPADVEPVTTEQIAATVRLADGR